MPPRFYTQSPLLLQQNCFATTATTIKMKRDRPMQSKTKQDEENKKKKRSHSRLPLSLTLCYVIKGCKCEKIFIQKLLLLYLLSICLGNSNSIRYIDSVANDISSLKYFVPEYGENSTYTHTYMDELIVEI